MNRYLDKYGRFHNKLVTVGTPYPCNNAWLYTAYCKKAGVYVDTGGIFEAYVECTKHGTLYRNPDQPTPPISRDEILGLVYLGYLEHHLVNHDWEFSPYRIPSFNLFKLISQLWQCRNQHRNYFWQNNLDQIYRFAFSVPLQDRYFVLQKARRFKWYKPSHILYAGISLLDKTFGTPSGIRYLKYGGEENKKAMLTEFPTDHPIHDV